MAVDPFTGLPLEQITTGITNNLGSAVVAETVVQPPTIVEGCPLEKFVLESEDSLYGPDKRKVKKYKYKYKYAHGGSSSSGSQTCGTGTCTETVSLKASDTYSVKSSSDDDDIYSSRSIPESDITVGKHQVYREGIKNQTKQIRKLALAVNKTFKTLGIIKTIAVEQIVDSKEIYERRIRDMTMTLKKEQEAMNDRLKVFFETGAKQQNTDQVFPVAGMNMEIKTELVCLVKWFVNLHNSNVPLPNSKAELEWLYEAWKLKGTCPCQWHDENYVADAAEEEEEDESCCENRSIEYHQNVGDVLASDSSDSASLTSGTLSSSKYTDTSMSSSDTYSTSYQTSESSSDCGCA